jgi:NlpC/P60 family putative phage cell wall peptidase
MSTPSRQSIIEAAKSYQGTPYLHGASMRGVGCDCLGLILGVWRDIYGAEPPPLAPYGHDWMLPLQAGDSQHRKNPLLEAAQTYLVARPQGQREVGDVLLFRWRFDAPAAHLGILMSEDTFMHAHDGACVAQTHLHRWWQARLVGAYGWPQQPKETP